MNTAYLKREGKPDLAYIHHDGTGPLVMFCVGFKSDMQGTKALYLEDQCRARGQAYIRFDYSGHGESGGAFEDGTIGIWKDDALAVLDHVRGDHKVVLVGSSMGGWIALLMALERTEQMAGLVGIAAAPDFSRDFAADRLTDQQRKDLAEKGYFDMGNEYSDEPYIITQNLIDDGEKQCLLDDTYNLGIPFHLIQGKQDADVPWEKALAIQKSFGADAVEITFVEDGDHRLSRDQDLAVIDQAIQQL